MWRDTDSWFLLEFDDGAVGYAHLDANGNYIGLFRADGTAIADDAVVGYTCVDDNTETPLWYTPEA